MSYSDCEKVDAYYRQRIRSLNIIMDDYERAETEELEFNNFITKRYVQEKLTAILQGTFNIHETIKQEFEKEEWVTNHEFRKLKKKMKMVDEL